MNLIPPKTPTALALTALALLVLLLPTSSCAQGGPSDPANRVEIVRTEFGVPHILAEDLEAMGFGLGFAQSEDFGPSIATAMIQSRGTYSRYIGTPALGGDFGAREIHARAVATFSQLDPRTQSVYSGFAQGVNRYIERNRDEFPDWMPADFTGVDALARDVQTWSRGDAARFVRSFERDPERNLEAQQAGNQPEPSPEEEAAELAFLLDGSNAWALDGSRTTSGNAILLRNPHLSWGDESELLTRVSGLTYYEAHVRVPGVIEFYGDFRIGSAFGIIGGFNERLGWATTNNSPRYSQVYGLARHPELEDHALIDGNPLPITERTTTVDYLDNDGATAVSSRTQRWTEYGPVIHETSERIYILKDPRDGEFRRGEQFLRMMMSQNLDEWLEVMHMRAHPSSNFTYADADGNIAHYYNARLPLLPHAATGDTAAFAESASDIWSELVPWDDLPLYLNPPGGYVQQANDPPDFSNLNVVLDRDTVATNLPDPLLRLRSQLSIELIHNDNQFTVEELIELKHTPRMLMAERLMDQLLAVLIMAEDDRLGEAFSVLEAWDRTAAAESRGGVLFKEWSQHYFAPPDTAGLWEEPWEVGKPADTPRGIGNPVKAIEAMALAIAALEEDGIAIDARWGDVHRIVRGDVDEPAFGCEPTLGCFRALSFEELPDGRRAANRGDAWVLFVEFGDRPHGYTVLSYGQTARTDSPHFDDQAGMFARGELKTVAWTDEEIAAQEIRRYRPGR